MHNAIRTMLIAGLSAPLFLVAQSGANVKLPQDKGPDKINVSSYPAEQQKGYKVFVDKCSKCHTIARPINTTMTEPEWSRYVKRMMHKPNSGISDSQGKTIYEFLAYDQVNRKDKNPSAFSKSLSDDEIEKLKAEQH
jgi:mono/diheme cytochrome c family protein